MITPDLSGQVDRSQPEFGRSEHRHAETRQAPQSPGRKRHDKTRQKGHILIEKHSHERNVHGETPPHTRAKGIHKNLQSRPSDSQTKHLELVKELHTLGEKLDLCYEELKSGYMREIVRDVDLNKVNSDNILALKDLFQELMNEMIYLRKVLSQYNLTKDSHIDSVEKHQKKKVVDILSPDDLVYLKGPITENRITTILQERFNSKCYITKIGPVHLFLNPFSSFESKEDPNLSYLRLIITKSLDQLFEKQNPQMLILSGERNSGKSCTAQLLIKELMNLSCRPSQTDLIKQLNATVTVLNSLGKARTMNNKESSKVAVLYEFYFNKQIMHKTQVKCIPTNMSRIVQPREDDNNFGIFYQIFAGLSPKDRANLQLQTHSDNELRYLYNYPSNNQSEIEALRKHFQSWTSALHFLGIPFIDVTKVLAAILLLGNVQFSEKSSKVLEVQGGDFELKSVAVLLGVPYVSLFRGLTKKLKVMKSDATIQSCSENQANYHRDVLAKTLYSRMLSAIIRRCNCPRKSTFSSDYSSPTSSTEFLNVSNHNGHANETMTSHNLDNQVLGIADLFGFDKSDCNRMEQICANLCSETIQHFYTTHIFKSAEGYCSEEGIQNIVDVDYLDNSQCIELLTCQDRGILTFLDQETMKNGTTENFVEKLHSNHADNAKFFTTNCKANEFGITHHTGEVIYDADELLHGNNDSVPFDVIHMFSPEQCSFGFVVHLFASDHKSVAQNNDSNGRGIEKYIDRFTSTSTRTISQEFQEKLDELLNVLIHADPWFILCLKSNLTGVPCQLDPEVVTRQVRALQVFESVYLLRSGYTHRMRLISFAQRYFVNDDQLSQNDALEIIQSYQKFLNKSESENPGKILYIGKKHVFFSELLRQELEKSRRKECLTNHLRRNSFDTNGSAISQTELYSKKDISTNSGNQLLETSHSSAESAPNTPPAIPKRRGYTVVDNKKISFPQMRVMTDNYRDNTYGQNVVFSNGECIKVIGASPKAGYLSVESRNKTGWVPSKLTKLMTDDMM